MAKMTLDELVAQLQKAYGDELRAVVLYGSAAAGELIPKRSDYNVLVIVDALPAERLRASAATARAWKEGGSPPPLTLTTAEWRGSADIFPMEYADILERHRVLYGTPPFEGITVDPPHLRLQLEHEAMGTLLHFRQGVLGAGGEHRAQTELLTASLSRMMVLFRALVRLHGGTPSTDYEVLSREAAGLGGLDAEAFVRVVRHVRGERRLDAAGAADTLVAYLAQLERLMAHIDRTHV